MAATAGEVVIARRDLRNRIGEIWGQAPAGQSFVATTRSRRVTRLVPTDPHEPTEFVNDRARDVVDLLLLCGLT